MIVTCARCATQFQLDEAKVPDDGVRVRCSRCEHAFVVTAPTQSDSRRAADLAIDALGGVTAPDASDELEIDDLDEDGLLVETSSLPESPPESESESDWGFNDDLDALADLDSVRDAVDELLAGVAPIESGQTDAPELAKLGELQG